MTAAAKALDVSAYTAMGAGETLRPYRFATREFGPAEVIELSSLSEVNVALERLRQNRLGYRVVLVNQG